MYNRDESGKLLNRHDYDKALAELRERHPWLGTSVVRPSPGHIFIVRSLLQDIEEIAGGPKVSAIEFLRITQDHDNELQAFVHIDIDDTARQQALATAIYKAKHVSGRSCAACGRRLERCAHQRLCEEHLELGSLFAGGDSEKSDEASSLTAGEGEVDAKKTVTRKPIFNVDPFQSDDEMEAMCGKPMEDAADAAGEAEPAAAEIPSVRIFDPADIQKIAQGGERSGDRDQQNRLRNLVKRLKEVDPFKPLALVPDDWTAVLARLMVDFPNFTRVIEFVGDQLALSRLGDGRLRLPPLLMLGPPGIGKTELALMLAEIFAVSCLRVDMASSQSGATLCGSDAFWSNSEHGQLLEILLFGDTANPVVMLEELDKTAGDSRFSPTGPLYSLLEERTASRFADLSVKDLTVNASHVIWLASANALEAIPEPLRSRFNVFEVPAPSREQCRAIVRSIYGRLREENIWGALFPAVLEEVVEARLASFPPRQSKALLLRACGHAARQERTHITISDVEQAVRAEKEGIGFLASIA